MPHGEHAADHEDDKGVGRARTNGAAAALPRETRSFMEGAEELGAQLPPERPAPPFAALTRAGGGASAETLAKKIDGDL